MAQGGVSVEAEENFAQSKEALDITLLGSEWNSSAGGLSTLNREFAIHLSQQPHVRVSVLVPEGACKDEDKKAAQNFGINVLDACQQPGFSEPLDWLCFPPQDHRIDVVVGHGVKLGRQVNVIKRSPQFQNCKWVHVVHTAPEDLSKYKGYANPASRGEQKHWDEVGLCKYADLVVPVGPRLKKAYSSYLQGCKKVEDIFEIVPGLFHREFGDLVQQAKVESDDDFKVLLCGRGDDEDFELKGYDIAVKAFADLRLKGKRYYLLFVGAPDGKQDEVRRRLLNCGITDEQVTVRKFVQSRAGMRDLFCEVDLVIMPSKSEGFGLVALEALSAGLPVLVGSNSGFARAVQSIPFGAYSIVDSADPVKWAEAIEGVSVRHRVCLQESKLLREAYGQEYCWKRQCQAFVDKLWRMVHVSSTCEASAADSLVEEQPIAIPGPFCQAQGAVISYRKNARISGQRKTSSEEKGMDANVINQRPNPQLPAVSKYKKKEGKRKDKKVSGTSRVERSLCAFGDNFIKLRIDVSDLTKEEGEKVYKFLIPQVQEFVKCRDYSSNQQKGVRDLTKFINKAYEVSLMAVKVGSLEITLECPTLRSLEHLWNDYLSGYLNKVAERYLVTDEMKTKLGLETINLKATIDEENYLACRKFLTKIPVEADCVSIQDLFDLEASTSEMNTPSDYTDAKDQDTSCTMRIEKAKVSRSALHRASINGQYEEVNTHLKNGANVDERDQFLLTPLHLACWYGYECVVKLLLDHNADVNAVDRFQFTPLQKAERCNHQSIIQLLLDHDAKPSLQQPLSLRTSTKRAFLHTDSHSGFNLLQAAVLQGDYGSVYRASNYLENFVEEMKSQTISNNASIFRGKSAVDILSALDCRKPGHADIEKLYQRLVEIDETLNELHSCAKSGDVEKVIELVLNDGIDVNVAAKSKITPLLLASPMSSGVLIKTLIDLGADVNAQTAPGKEGPLLFAASSNNYVVTGLLLEHGADVNIQDNEGNSPLLLSFRQGFFSISQLLVNAGFHTKLRSKARETLLYKTVTQKYVPLFKLLLENEADVNKRDRWAGQTPLHKAVTQKDVPLVKLLLENKAHVNIREWSGETPLHKAVTQKDVPLVKLLLENKADVDIQGENGETPLHKAVRQKYVPPFKLLLENKADVNKRDRWGGETPLHKAVTQKDVPLVKLLLENKADVNIRDWRGETPLHKAVTQKDVPLVKLLLENKAGVNISDEKGETPLHKAVTQKDVPLVKLLLENKADVDIQDRWGGETPLHKAVKQKDVPLVKLLLENKADVNILDFWGETPLHKAVTQKDVPLVKLLLENKADVNIQDRKGETPLHKAVTQNDVPLVKLLLENKADVNIRDLSGETPLHKAVTQKDVPLVKLLLENKADVNIPDWSGETPLHKAVTQKDVPLVKLLLENKADVDIQGNNGETLLHKAVTQKDVPLVKLLLENKADVDIQGEYGETPLYKAVRQKDVPLVKLLLENKADVNIRDRWAGGTPLHKAVTQKDVPLVKLLLENKAIVNLPDGAEGNTPLHLCALYGLSEISQLLIKSGCNINLRNYSGETPLDIQKRLPLRRVTEGKEVSWVEPMKTFHDVEPKTSLLRWDSDKSLEEDVRKAEDNWQRKEVLMKKKQELSSREEESQARVTQQPQMTKEAKKKEQTKCNLM
ncbi:serine/threonine-protein phosphatase 6 regulatory ankyrin repeat subunit A-like [Montipora capricornis]|uniref:serine/threonine-protein phosphatase 6 regulatory ankyrin repeat subunit A-like n=1 Tax=Montipora capricornis TaxID=246305 RepID=UPI0035F17430